MDKVKKIKRAIIEDRPVTQQELQSMSSEELDFELAAGFRKLLGYDEKMKRFEESISCLSEENKIQFKKDMDDTMELVGFSRMFSKK
jgi:hypothetical protein